MFQNVKKYCLKMGNNINVNIQVLYQKTMQPKRQ